MVRARPELLPGPGEVDGARGVRTFVYPGGIHVCAPPATLITIVGSCVAVCVRAPSGAAGGLVHFLMPRGPGHAPTRMGYANHAIPELLARVAELAVGEGPLEVQLAGGALVRGAAHGRRRRLGEENVAAARRLLAAYDVKLVSEAVGGCFGRRVAYDVGQGAMSVEELGATDDAE